MNTTHVLVVDDDPKIRKLLLRCFEGEGYAVHTADTRASALQVLSETAIDLITLDLQLGADDGLELARTIWKTTQVPIIMLTGKDDVIDRIVGLEIGADDYITKPFHIREVLARVRTVLRRSERSNRRSVPMSDADLPDLHPECATVRFEGLVAVRDRLELWGRDGRLCDLTSGDFRLLNVFLDNPKRVLSRERLMDLINGPDWTPLDRTIDNQVARLRKKIERDPADPRIIKTVRGTGYMLACDIEPLNCYSGEKSA
ncbi:response regulator [Sulfitobacter sabulilitoris]|uniref:Response regulator transcription factor n=1 Tax=Sulfitobacter sabulilitoris TaxID=2562655 RepID=A0A5S3Q3V4_9RHOB|nr:response regulator transcription factor [Sulfitobacter sabulilitoris]TMM51201.1 response regulator transcription factor [Sulfitobacter sabulilitoris]